MDIQDQLAENLSQVVVCLAQFFLGEVVAPRRSNSRRDESLDSCDECDGFRDLGLCLRYTLSGCLCHREYSTNCFSR